MVAVFFTAGNATNYYVNATSGNNTNNGLTPQNPFKTLQKAADNTQAGDTVFVMNGTYTKDNSWSSDVVVETSSGTESNWIVWINYLEHKPVISFDCWRAFNIKGSFIEINGLAVKGNNGNLTLEEALNQPKSCANPSGSYDPRFNGNGISVDGRNGSRYHHIKILNCEVYDCGGAGISFIQSDYVTVENNIVYNNSWYTLWASSGISLWQFWNSDNNTGVKNTIRNNICFGNWQYIPAIAFNCSFTDGNGIIIDDSENTQNGSSLGSYNGRTLIENNLAYRNGGSGIHTFKSKHVDIINNTAYMNNLSEHLNSGQIFPNASADIRIFNNILVAPENKRINSNWNNSGEIFYDYNLHYGGNSTALKGEHTIVADPLFVDAENNNFMLLPESPAIDAGVSVMGDSDAPAFDITGTSRPVNKEYDIGAYEYTGPVTGNILKNKRNSDEFNVWPNPASGYVRLTLSVKKNNTFRITVYNLKGEMFLDTSKTFSNQGVNSFIINLNLQPGLYLLAADNQIDRYVQKLVVK